ncbi:MAG: hypothetical protein K9K67_15090 [Bacteriovoracaceae bacterium]|nr:hypothetical protein [Bacteriovoracaceae bacterium]
MEDTDNMLEEIHANILEKIKFDKLDKFEILLKSTITHVWSTEKEPDPRFHSVSFKLAEFFDGFTGFLNFYGKENKYQAGVEALSIICNELQIDIDEGECFLIFHIRNLGKFRKRESELLLELKNLWTQYPNYKMEDREFSKALKNLMRNKFINYRKGNLHLNPSVLLRYRV